MKHIQLNYGKGTVTVRIPQKNFLGILASSWEKSPLKKFTDSTRSPHLPEAEIIRHSIIAPISSPGLSQILNPGDKVAIITSDITRPVPSHKILPPIVETIKAAGVPEEQISIILALGIHRKHTPIEQQNLVGEEIYRSKITVMDSDPDQCVNLGTCRNGTPVDIFRPAAEADKRICIGNIELHYFAGYSGGAKAIMPGVSSRKAIEKNHALMTHPLARAGLITGNPIREDIDQIHEFLPVDFICNVVLDEEKRVIAAFSGHYKEAHRAGCRFVDEIYKVPFPEKGDIVIASAGGFPKDMDLYQSQKALYNASFAVKPGGIIILCASAAEGFGELTFQHWMISMTPDRILEKIKEEFVLGGHKAAAIASILKTNQVFAVSDLHPAVLRQIGFVPFSSVQKALDTALVTAQKAGGPDTKVLIMPQAGAALPVV